jgi:hypothetical protein
MRVEQLGETLLEKGCPPDPFPKPFIAFSAQGVCDTLSRKSSRVQKKSMRKNAPKRVPTVARQVCHNKCGFIAVYLVHSWVSSSEKIFLRALFKNSQSFLALGSVAPKCQKSLKGF